MPVTLDSEGDGSTLTTEPVEVAAHFVVSEAIANVAKYARATEANIAVRDVTGACTSTSPTTASAARSERGSRAPCARPADRVAALDGTLSVESPPGRGTQLHVEIPCGPTAGIGCRDGVLLTLAGTRRHLASKRPSSE